MQIPNRVNKTYLRDFALDPTLFPIGTLERRVSEDIAVNARRAGRWLVEEARPDIVFLTTPHGIKLDYDYGIYISEEGSGFSTIGSDLGNCSNGGAKPYNVSLDVSLAPVSMGNEMLSLLRRNGSFPVSGIYSYDDVAPIPLNWGEIVPLLLLPQETSSSSSSPSFAYPKPLIWTFPYRRYDHSPEMVSELLQMGGIIMEWAQMRPERIGMIVSGDLSHTHQASGPYGYSNASALYDAAIGKWAKNDPCHELSVQALLEDAKMWQPNAKSCGFTGYVLWHGMMCHPIEQNRSNGWRRGFHSQVFANRNVTYYGMIVATFEPVGNVSISDARQRKRL